MSTLAPHKTVHPSPHPIVDAREEDTLARVVPPEGPWWGPDNYAPLGGPPPPPANRLPTRRIPRIVPLGKFGAGEEDQRPLSARECVMYTARAFEREYGLEYGAATGARTSRTAREGRGSHMKEVLQGRSAGKEAARMSLYEGNATAASGQPHRWDDRSESEVFDDGGMEGPISQAEAKTAATDPKTPPVSRSTRRGGQSSNGAQEDWKGHQKDLYERLATRFITKRDAFLSLDKDRDTKINRDDLGVAFEVMNFPRPPTGFLGDLCQQAHKEDGIALFAKPKFKRGKRPSITAYHDPEEAEKMKRRVKEMEQHGPGLDFETFCKQQENPPTVASVILGWRPDTAYRRLWGIEGDPSTPGRGRSGKENNPGSNDGSNQQHQGNRSQHPEERAGSSKAGKRVRSDGARREQMVRTWHRRFASRQPDVVKSYQDFLYEKEMQRRAIQDMEDAKRRLEIAKQKELDRLNGIVRDDA